MIACIDIGGTAIKVGISDEFGNLIHKDSLDVYHEKEALLTHLSDWIKKVSDSYLIYGVAMSIPGAVDSKTGLVGGSSAIPCIHEVNWKLELGALTNLPISIENDANCAALAEAFNGAGEKINDLLFLVCGTGIGGAIVKDGKIHHGKHFHGGEFGYMLMEEADGEFYNFSNVASTMSLVRKARAHYKDETYDGIRVFEEAAKGDEFCIQIIDRFYLNLAKGIFNLQYMYDPEMILIGGAISGRDDFLDRLNEALDYLLKKIKIATIIPKLGTCKHKADANLIGALAHFLQEYK